MFFLQFLVLVAFSAFVWHRFTLGIDFAEYSQAFSSIGTGHFDPQCTICGYPYLDSHFELGMWPLAFLYTIFRTTFVLLVVQAASLAVASGAAYFWIASIVRQALPSGRTRLILQVGAASVLVLNPLVYGSAALDFHLEATATALAVLSAYSIWRGSWVGASAFAGACLLCGDIGGLYVAGVGISALLAGRRSWRAGAAFVFVGVVWIGIIGAIGANEGSVTGKYAYLAGRSTLPPGFGAAVVLLGGMFRDPGRVLHALRPRLHFIGKYLLTGGVVGVATAWGFGVPALVLLSSALQQSTLFIGEPFQQVAVTPFVAVGTVMLICALLSDEIRVWWLSGVVRRLGIKPTTRLVASLSVAVLGVAAAAFESHRQLPLSFKGNAVAGFIPPREAAALSDILAYTPDGAEVIASLEISGRFGARRYIYLFDSPGTAIPIRSHTVVMVLDTAHTLQLASGDQDAAAIAKVESQLGAHLVGVGSDVVAVEWSAPRLDATVTLP